MNWCSTSTVFVNGVALGVRGHFILLYLALVIQAKIQNKDTVLELNESGQLRVMLKGFEVSLQQSA
jgi:hypothetical protein